MIHMLRKTRKILQKVGLKESDNTPLDLSFYPILSARELLETEARQKILKSLPALSALSINEYNLLYLKTIYNFSEFVQSLPETKNSYYSHKGGLLDHGLDRTRMALALCHAYFLESPSENDELKIPKQQQSLWIYAIFTASLLLDVGKLYVKQFITMSDRQGKILKSWSPFEGPMTLQLPSRTHYRFDFEVENKERLKSLVTPLLARQLLPVAGFNWLASDKNVLEAWLAILEDDLTGGGLIPMIIPLADAQTIEAQLFRVEMPKIETPLQPAFTDTANTPSLPQFFTPGVTSTGQPQVMGANLPTVATATTNAVAGSVSGTSTVIFAQGIAFLQWLRKSYASGNITINGMDGLIHRTAEGFVLLPKVFAEFSKANPQFKDPHVVAQQFSLLELSDRQQVYRLKTTDTETRIIKNAIVVDNFRLLPNIEKLPPLSENLTKLTTVVTELPKHFTISEVMVNKVEASSPAPEPTTPKPNG